MKQIYKYDFVRTNREEVCTIGAGLVARHGADKAGIELCDGQLSAGHYCACGDPTTSGLECDVTTAQVEYDINVK